VGEPQLACHVRHSDLTIVHVARQDELEPIRGQAVEDSRKVTEQDPKVGSRIQESIRVRKTLTKRPWVHSDNLHSPAAQLNDVGLIDKTKTAGPPFC
jgi:hypothetical protein